MAEITLVTATDPRRLLEAAADGFLSPLRASPDDRFPRPPSSRPFGKEQSRRISSL